MSELRRSRDEAERTARVWQPSDFYRLGPEGGFVAKQWREGGSQRFERSPTPTVSRPPVWSPAPEELRPEDAPAMELPPPEPAAELPAPVAAGSVSQQELEDARLLAYAKGQEHGREEARRQLQDEQQARERLLAERVEALAASVEALRQQPDQIHEPLKRLALHLAEQLVLGELAQSPQAIERLVRRCVEELGSAPQAPVRIELNPDDLALLQPWLAGTGDDAADAARSAPPWQLLPDERLRPGSVRASANDAVVTDLIEHRLEVMARQLRVDPDRVAAQSAFRPERLAARRAQVDAVLDAQPRMADAPRQSRFAPVVDMPADAADAAQAPEGSGPVAGPVVPPPAEEPGA